MRHQTNHHTAAFQVRRATDADREAIYRIRHDVYAVELGQHPANAEGRLTDSLDAFNAYVVVSCGEELAGFVSLTPPGSPRYSLDKYLPRDAWPLPPDAGLYEVRILTVTAPYRNRPVAALLLYAVLRVIEAAGGEHVVAIGRREVLPLYERVGLQPCGRTFVSGCVEYELMTQNVATLREYRAQFAPLVARLQRNVDWQLDCPFSPSNTEAVCYHGGVSFSAIGEDFATLERRHTIVNADVLDAWFPPAPGVVSTLQTHLPWLLQTAPPTDCAGMLSAIATARGVPIECLIPGAGSSDLIFRAFLSWLSPSSRVLLLDPTYGEYAHILERIIGCSVHRLALSPEEDFALSPERLAEAASDNFDLIVLVNPNNPTGTFLPSARLIPLLQSLPISTKVWVDEAYVDYLGSQATLEKYAAQSENAIVCKSLSKGLALSGARAAYLVAPPNLARELRRLTPPWVVSLPAQVATVHALQAPAYYAARYAETHTLRDTLHAALQAALPDIRFVSSPANWILAHLPHSGPTASQVVAQCQAQEVFLRDTSSMGERAGKYLLRIAVKDAERNQRILCTLTDVLSAPPPTS